VRKFRHSTFLAKLAFNRSQPGSARCWARPDADFFPHKIRERSLLKGQKAAPSNEDAEERYTE
jgi:hypothetical protein